MKKIAGILLVLFLVSSFSVEKAYAGMGAGWAGVTYILGKYVYKKITEPKKDTSNYNNYANPAPTNNNYYNGAGPSFGNRVEFCKCCSYCHGYVGGPYKDDICQNCGHEHRCHY